MQADRHLYTYIHPCMHAYIHTYIHTYVDTCIHTYVHSIIERLMTIYVNIHKKRNENTSQQIRGLVVLKTVVFILTLMCVCK